MTGRLLFNLGRKKVSHKTYKTCFPQVIMILSRSCQEEQEVNRSEEISSSTHAGEKLRRMGRPQTKNPSINTIELHMSINVNRNQNQNNQ